MPVWKQYNKESGIYSNYTETNRKTKNRTNKTNKTNKTKNKLTNWNVLNLNGNVIILRRDNCNSDGIEGATLDN